MESGVSRREFLKDSRVTGALIAAGDGIKWKSPWKSRLNWLRSKGLTLSQNKNGGNEYGYEKII